MPVSKYWLPAFVLVALLGSVLVAKATGQWIVSGRQMIDVTNLTSTSDIKGWMTLRQISDGFAIATSDLYRVLGIPNDVSPDTALKDMEELIVGFEVSGVRTTIEALRAAVPVAPTPEAGATMAPNPTATPTATPTAEAATTPAHTPQGDSSGTGPTPLPAGQPLTGADIKGRHSLKEISEQAQVSLPDLLAALKLPPDTEPSTTVKALVDADTIAEVQNVRDAVAALQNR